jgi:hypothetical protein
MSSSFFPLILAQQQTIRLKQKQRTKQISLIENTSDYPIDLWYLIAMYISPEDIGKFSLICRDSNHVVNTVCFWIRLFRK